MRVTFRARRAGWHLDKPLGLLSQAADRALIGQWYGRYSVQVHGPRARRVLHPEREPSGTNLAAIVFLAEGRKRHPVPL